MIILLSGLCLREKSHLLKQVNCNICMKLIFHYEDKQCFIYKIKIIIDNKTYPNRNLVIITKGSTLYGLASLSNIVAYSKQWPGDLKKLHLVKNSQ